LTETQFQLLYGPGWVLYAGQSIVGSQLANMLSISTLEDFRALFPRAGNNGRSDSMMNPAGDQPAGTTNVDLTLDHVHFMTPYTGNTGSNTGSPPITYPSYQPIQTPGARYTGNGTPSYSPGTMGAETAGKSGILNCFIRIN